VNRKGYGRKWLWLDLKYYIYLCLKVYERLWETSVAVVFFPAEIQTWHLSKSLLLTATCSGKYVSFEICRRCWFWFLSIVDINLLWLVKCFTLWAYQGSQFIQLIHFFKCSRKCIERYFLPEKICWWQICCRCRNNISDWFHVDQRVKLTTHNHPLLRLRIYVKLFRQKN
jgi:hypothetical protein